MRLRLRTGRTALFLAMFAVAILVFLPMRLALGWIGLDAQGFTARRASGTIWSGTLTEARLGDVDLGTMRAGLAPLPLLGGQARVAMRSRDGGDEPRLRGAVSVSRNAVGLDDASGLVPVGAAFGGLAGDRAGPVRGDGALRRWRVRARGRPGAGDAGERWSAAAALAVGQRAVRGRGAAAALGGCRRGRSHVQYQAGRKLPGGAGVADRRSAQRGRAAGGGVPGDPRRVAAFRRGAVLIG